MISKLNDMLVMDSSGDEERAKKARRRVVPEIFPNRTAEVTRRPIFTVHLAFLVLYLLPTLSWWWKAPEQFAR